MKVDKSHVELAPEEARSQNITLNELLHELSRDWLKGIVGWIRARNCQVLMNELRYADAGRKFMRDEMNERR